ncbi:flagellar motor protein MotB [Fundidesulfovibrio terrae]|uniref:flagellar motor protein MotB n=1 Tax=Fundidesulfovibrio terrae TaxID=2922866 RepID=UPI001FAF01F3|nr:flagellar motor protein MotB [Fundidesulfovibrio terrae]
MADKEHKKVIIKKVKKGGHGGAHGGSWKVAYADFVTAMMAFFLVMWLVNSVTVEKREQIAQYFQSFSLIDTGGRPGLIPATDLSQVAQENNPPNIVEPISENPASPAKEKSEAEKAAEAIKEAIEAKTPDMKDQIIVKTEADKVIVEVTDDAKGKPLFALGKSDLTQDAKRALAAAAPPISKAGKGKLTIEGHTDAYTYAGERFTNWELSTDRASAARRELEKAGVSPDSVGVVAGYAATRPFVPDNVYDPKNRRIRLVMEVPQPPKEAGSDSGAKAKTAEAKGKPNIFDKPQEPPAPPVSPIPKEKREILDQQIERLYDESIKGKQ